MDLSLGHLGKTGRMQIEIWNENTTPPVLQDIEVKYKYLNPGRTERIAGRKLIMAVVLVVMFP